MTEAVTTEYLFVFPEECVGLSYEVVDILGKVIAAGFVPDIPYAPDHTPSLGLVSTETLSLPWHTNQRYEARLVALPGTSDYTAHETHPVGWTSPELAS
jgi:hypothetical protein